MKTMYTPNRLKNRAVTAAANVIGATALVLAATACSSEATLESTPDTSELAQQAQRSVETLNEQLKDPLQSGGVPAEFLKGSLTIKDVAGSITFNRAVVVAYADKIAEAEGNPVGGWIAVPSSDKTDTLALSLVHLPDTTREQYTFSSPVSHDTSRVYEGTIRYAQGSDGPQIIAQPNDDSYRAAPITVRGSK